MVRLSLLLGANTPWADSGMGNWVSLSSHGQHFREVMGWSDPATLGNSCHLPSQAMVLELSLDHVKDKNREEKGSY